MCFPNYKLCGVLLLSLAALAFERCAIGDDSAISANLNDAFAAAAEDLATDVRFAIDDQFDENFRLTQTPPAATPRATRSRSRAVVARRRRSTYRLPSMFGDFYGGSSLQATIQLPSMQIQQSFLDNVGGIDFFVTNNNGSAGADPNPAVGIMVLDRNSANAVVTVSNGPGVPVEQSIAYPIEDPSARGFFLPQAPGPGTIAYIGGTATFAGPIPPGPVDVGDGWGIAFSHLFTPDPILVNLPSGGGSVRRVKIGENNSPIPRDRLIFNYNFFNDVIGDIGDVNRYTVGFEHTLFSDNNSIEVVFPMASSLDVDQIAGGIRSTDTEFGDLTVVFKQQLFDREEFLVSAGVGLTVPTGDDARVFLPTGQQIIDLKHSSTHLLPFLGMLHTYESGWYWQSFLQLDFDLNGNPISADMTGANLQSVGVLQDQTLMFVDFGVGYWLRSPDQGTPAVAGTAELHWVGTLQDADTVNAAGMNITSVSNRYDVLNLSLGASVLVNESFTIRPAMVIPLADGDGEQFDYEAMVQMNFWR